MLDEPRGLATDVLGTSVGRRSRAAAAVLPGLGIDPAWAPSGDRHVAAGRFDLSAAGLGL